MLSHPAMTGARMSACQAADRDIKAADRAINNDHENKVMKILASNGTAPRTQATSDNLHRMHVKRSEPLRLPEPVGPQIMLTDDGCYTH